MRLDLPYVVTNPLRAPERSTRSGRCGSMYDPEPISPHLYLYSFPAQHFRFPELHGERHRVLLRRGGTGRLQHVVRGCGEHLVNGFACD